MQIEVIVWHHHRRTVTPPYSASAYLIDPSQPKAREVIAAGSCSEAHGELVAAREALRDLRAGLRGTQLADPQLVALVDGALTDPERVIRERR